MRACLLYTSLLTHFSHNLTLYSHNQLYGVWRVVKANEQPQTTRVLRVRLQTADNAILLYSASDIEMLTPEQLLTHPFLQRVGPDVLDMSLTPGEVKALSLIHIYPRAVAAACYGTTPGGLPQLTSEWLAVFACRKRDSAHL